MTLTLADVAQDPSQLTFNIQRKGPKQFTLRPLETGDLPSLTDFFANLSDQTRNYYSLEDTNERNAQIYCGAIKRYDKLRYLLIEKISDRCIGLFEFSFDIPVHDLKRFASHGIKLDSGIDCRFAPCLADSYQNHGIGTNVFPSLIRVAQAFGQKRMILWGGVLAKNHRAIAFYQKIGFKMVGVFKNSSGKEALDMILSLGSRHVDQ